MALLKELRDDRGIVSFYHRIANIQQNFINAEPVIEVYVYHYSEAEYREIEKQKIVENIDFQNIVGTDRYLFEVNDSLGATRHSFYERLKAEVPEYEGATDV